MVCVRFSVYIWGRVGFKPQVVTDTLGLAWVTAVSSFMFAASV